MTSVLTQPDRRSARRYGLQTPLRYRPANGPLNAAWKHGSTLNMSAGGLLIDIPEPIALGSKWELAIDWIGLYHDRQKMRLFVTAAVTRTGHAGTAVRILSHRFRDMSPARVRLPRVEKKLAVA